MPSIDACGARLFYSVEGSGTPVILLHGSATTGAQWKPLARHLSSRWKVVVPDLPGYGSSQVPVMTDANGFEAYALAILDLIEHLGGRAHVVGHSMGGAVAMRLAIGAPRSILSLCVIEPATFHLLRAGDSADRALFNEIQFLSRGISASVLDGNPTEGVRRFIDYWNEAGTWSLMHSSQRIKASQSLGRVIDDFSAGFAETWPLELCGELDMPVLAVMGMQGPTPAQRTTEIIAEAVPGAQLRMVADGGHMVPVTHPAIINAMIGEFIAGAGRARSEYRISPRRAA